MSWIHIEDEVKAIIHCLEDTSIHGAVNLVSPNPVQSQYFYKTLAQVMHRPCLFTIPECIIKLVLSDMAEELLLTNQKVYPEKLLSKQFSFIHPDLYEALHSLLL